MIIRENYNFSNNATKNLNNISFYYDQSQYYQKRRKE